MGLKKLLLVSLALLCPSPGSAIVISEVMYHPQTDELHNEWVEIYNEQSTPEDIGRWQFTGGIHYTFTTGTLLQPHAFLVVARDPATIMSRYGITNVVGPFTGALNNGTDHVILRDPAGGIIAEVQYEDTGKWPVSPDGAGHSLSKLNLRGDPNDADNWRASVLPGGTPGRDNGFQAWYEDTVLIAPGNIWWYFKGVSEATTPRDRWRQISFVTSAPLWLQGPTGIGYADGDDATTVTGMQNVFWSIYCRKTFTVSDPTAIDQLILEVDHDDGFIVYLNNTDVGRAAMSVTTGPVYYNTPAVNHSAVVDGGTTTVLDITPYKGALVAGTNVLAVQVHNNALNSSDLSFIPKLRARKVHLPGQAASSVVINEVCFHTSGTQFIELHNTSDAPVNIGRHYLSNDPDNLQLYRITTNTMIAAHGYATFLRGQLGFRINPLGDRILLTSPTGSVVLDAAALEPPRFDWSVGRWPDGKDEWYNMVPTTGTANSVTLTTSVVINEIMYDPPTYNSHDEYIELYNVGATPVSLAGWSFTHAVRFDFPSSATIGPGQYLVIAKDRNRLISRYGLSPSIVLGNTSGTLANGGDKVRLRDANKNVADEVIYADGGHWPEFAKGYGSSLELIDPRQDNKNYQAWAPSDETGKAQWTFYSYSSVVATRAQQDLHELQFYLMGPGVTFIDDIHLTAGATEYMANGTFETGMGTWLAFGDHIQSYVTTQDAHTGTRCLKIIATDTGDTGANHIEQDAQVPMPSGQTYTLSFWAKWQWGSRVLVTRCFDNQLAETHFLATPLLTGTPGARNSVYRANMGPVFRKVAHSPVIPAPASPVHITARAYDPDGVTSVTLYYKADSDGIYTGTRMFDDGLHGDGLVGDGIYGADIPARAAGQTVAFYMRGRDSLAALNTWPTDITHPALYRVETAPLTSPFPIYRIITTAADYNLLWNGRPHLSNEALNCTFIFDEKDIYYNCNVNFIGSPFHRADGRLGYTGYKVGFNANEKLWGYKAQARVDFNTGTGFYTDRISYTLQRWMGLPNCPQEFVFVRINQTSCSNQNGHLVWEDTTPPGGLYLSMYYRGDDDGYMYETDDRFELTDNNATNDLSFATFNNYDANFTWSGPDKDLYRNNYKLRSHNNEDDYTSMILLLNVLNNVPDSGYDAAVANLMNVEEWFKLFAVRACLSDWDFFAFTRGKHAYLYWPPTTHKCDALGWDSEWTFQPSRATMSIWSNFSTINRFQQRPKHQRLYFTYLQEMLDKYFTHAALDSWIDYYYATVGGQLPTDAKNFIDLRRAYLLGQIPTAPCDITTNGGNPFLSPDITVTLDGTAPVKVRWIRIGGVEYVPDWTGPTTWRLAALPLAPGVNNLVLQFLDYDRNLVGTDSITVTAPSGPLSFVMDLTSVTVPEGGTARFNVKLSWLPAQSMVVGVSRISGDSDISVLFGATLIFSQSNWNTWQPVTLTAAPDADTSDGQAVIRLWLASGPFIPNTDMVAIEADNTLRIVTDRDYARVPEGGTMQFGVRLNALPAGTVNVSVSRVAGDSDITVQSGTALTFTPSNWDTYQYVTLADALNPGPANGQATIRMHVASGRPAPDKDVVAEEVDLNTAAKRWWNYR
jgi:hypothetical protein